MDHHQPVTTLTITQTLTSATGALLEGDHAGALTLLQSALAHAKAGIEGRPDSTTTSSSSTAGWCATTGASNFQVYALPLELDDSCNDSRDGDSLFAAASCPCSLFSFYNAALITDEMCVPLERAFSSELSATILYNLGLVYHRIALLTGTTSFFKKALKLYDVAASIVMAAATAAVPPAAFLEQQQQQQLQASNNDNGMTILKLALCVNMGHIYSNFCDQDGTARCAAALQDTFNRFVDTNSLTGEVRKLFHQNMFVATTQQHHQYHQYHHHGDYQRAFMGVAPAA